MKNNTKGKKYVEGEPPHGCGGIEALGDAHESEVVAVEDFDQLREVHQ